jgi:hypothetical protein
MKKLILITLLITQYSFCPLIFGQDPISLNPNNSKASVTLSWDENTARIRVGGSGYGVLNGFDVQGLSDKKFIHINDGLLQVFNPSDPNANVGLSWNDNTARIRVGGSGYGALNGFDVQGLSDKKFIHINDGLLQVFNPSDPNANVGLSWNDNIARIRIGGSGTGSRNGFEIQTVDDVKLFRISHEGNAAIYGHLEAKEIKIQEAPTADFVFENNYELKKLEEVESFIKENKHLPDFPSGKEIEEHGVNLGEMDAKLLQKIEELTLYMIQMNKEIENLKEENRLLKKQKSL